jgi:hypothetical protein
MDHNEKTWEPMENVLPDLQEMLDECLVEEAGQKEVKKMCMLLVCLMDLCL